MSRIVVVAGVFLCNRSSPRSPCCVNFVFCRLGPDKPLSGLGFIIVAHRVARGAQRRTTVGSRQSASASSPGPRHHSIYAHPGAIGQFSALPPCKGVCGRGSFVFLDAAFSCCFFEPSGWCLVLPIFFFRCVLFAPFLSFLPPVSPGCPCSQSG